MNKKSGFQLMSAVAAVGTVGLMAMSNGCSAAAAAQGCSGLDIKVQAQATVKAFTDAATALETAAAAVEAKWMTVCNAMNTDLGLDATKTSAADACGVFRPVWMRPNQALVSSRIGPHS